MSLIYSTVSQLGVYLFLPAILNNCGAGTEKACVTELARTVMVTMESLECSLGREEVRTGGSQQMMRVEESVLMKWKKFFAVGGRNGLK